MEKKIPVWLLVLVIISGLNFTVLFGWLVRHVAEGGGKLGKFGTVVLSIAQFPSLVKLAFVEVTAVSPLLIYNRFDGIDGLNKNGTQQEGSKKDDGYLLLSAYDTGKKQSVVKLIHIGTQQVIHEWAPDIKELAKVQKTTSPLFDLNDMTTQRYRIYHPLLLDDGGLLFSGVEGPLFKINACSKIVWEIDNVFHHSKEQDADGNFWVPSFVEPNSFYKEKFAGYRDDAIVKVSPDGKVLYKKSVSKIIEENGYLALLLGTGNYDEDTIHLNDIQPALTTTKYWEKGDLLISWRHKSTVFLYRPHTNKIIWLKTGPWLNQHDVNFVGHSKISVYGNNVVRMAGAKEVLLDGHNQLYLYDFADESVSMPFAEIFKEKSIRTLSEGRGSFLENGDAFIEETNYGRALRVSTKQAIWEFVEKADGKNAGLLAWSRYLTKENVDQIQHNLEQSKCYSFQL